MRKKQEETPKTASADLKELLSDLEEIDSEADLVEALGAIWSFAKQHACPVDEILAALEDGASLRSVVEIVRLIATAPESKIPGADSAYRRAFRLLRATVKRQRAAADEQARELERQVAEATGTGPTQAP